MAFQKNITHGRYINTHTHTHIQREREREILKSWLAQLWELASPKFVGQASILETQSAFDAAVLKHNFFSGKSVLLLRPSTDWMRPTFTIKGNLLYLKSTDCAIEVNHICKTLSQQ